MKWIVEPKRSTDSELSECTEDYYCPHACPCAYDCNLVGCIIIPHQPTIQP